jgi:F0F1-type ATP synthase assembly protein I
MSYMLSKDQLCEQEKKEAEIKKAERAKTVQDSITKEKTVQKNSGRVSSTVLFCVLIAAVVGILVLFGAGVIKTF